MSKDLRELIFSGKRAGCCTECFACGGIICPVIKMQNYDLYLYGAGKDISLFVLYFENLGIEVKGIFDEDPQKEGQQILGRVPVICPSYITKRYDPENTFVIIKTARFQGIEQAEILSVLSKMGITKFYAPTEQEKSMIREKQVWDNCDWFDYFREHSDELERFYNSLYDDRSKQVMYEYIRTYMQVCRYSLPEHNSSVKYFYGQYENGEKEELYRHLENEVWLNCGSSIGDTIFWYFANGLNAETIYACDGDRASFERLKKNLDYLPERYRSKVRPVCEWIGKDTDWKKLGGKKITLINADIEGAELEMLRGIEGVIRDNRPVMAICVYHKASDFVDIPHLINSIVNDYEFVVRKYASIFKGNDPFRATEMVLYAIPKERILCRP